LPIPGTAKHPLSLRKHVSKIFTVSSTTPSSPVAACVAACVAVCCSVFQLFPPPHHPHLLQCVAGCVVVCCSFFCSVLQCVSIVSSTTPSLPVVVCYSVCCSMLLLFFQCIALCFNCLLHHTTLTCCSVLQRVLQYVAAFFPVYCSVFQLSPSPHPHLLQCVAAYAAVCCRVLQCIAVCFNCPFTTPSSPVAVCCSVRCNMLQHVLQCAAACVTVYCSVFQLSSSPHHAHLRMQNNAVLLWMTPTSSPVGVKQRSALLSLMRWLQLVGSIKL